MWSWSSLSRGWWGRRIRIGVDEEEGSRDVYVVYGEGEDAVALLEMSVVGWRRGVVVTT